MVTVGRANIKLNYGNLRSVLLEKKNPDFPQIKP